MSDSYQVNLNNLMQISINNDNNVKKNIDIIKKLIDIMAQEKVKFYFLLHLQSRLSN